MTLVLAAAAAAALVACGGDGEPEPTGAEPVAAPEASEFPQPTGTIDDLLAEVGTTNEVGATPASGTFTPGDERFSFALLTVAGAQILDANVAVYASRGISGKALGPFPARLEDLSTLPLFVADTTTPDDAKGVYVSEVPFNRAGEWRIAVVIDQGDGFVATPLTTSVFVSENQDIPEVGDTAPVTRTPTLQDVDGDAAEIDTRIPPSSMHEDDFAEVVGKEPVVLLFATPALCQSRVCGPVVDIAEQVKSVYDDDAAFIHMEIFEDNVYDPDRLRSQPTDYGLQSEPWLFVIDASGKITMRIEGAFSANELEEALEPLIN